MNIAVVILILAASALGLDDPPVAETENGLVFGLFEKSATGKVYRAFKGIPYAKPPVDDNRFKEPQRLKSKWIGSWNGQQFGSPCLQLDQFTRTRVADKFEYKTYGSEDCLFVNVYTQEGGPANKTVIFMIHGGAFMFGSSNIYGPEFVMDRDDIVFVTFNYRVGPLGFLTTGDKAIPGNNGLKDQAAALAWVRRNIANFGGDPEKVAIAGMSAGGASVDYMYLSRHTDGLFKRGYSLSGSSLCSWALVHDGVERTKKLAELLGCPTTDSSTILKCLRRRPAEQIVDQVRQFLVWQYHPFTVFGPVIEVRGSNPYLDKHPRDILTQGMGKDLPWIAGVTTEEGLYPAADFVGDETFLQQLSAEWDTIGKNLLFIDSKKHSDQKQAEIANVAKKHYIGEGEINKNNRAGLVRLLSERLFFSGVAEAAKLRASKNKSHAYVYLYGYRSAMSFADTGLPAGDNLGVCHGDDMILGLIKMGLVNYDLQTKEDEKVAEIIQDIFFTFETTGAVPEKYNWPPVSGAADLSSLSYLRINSATDVKPSTDPIADFEFLHTTFSDKVFQKDEL